MPTRYTSNFLSRVIYRLDFSPILAISNELLASFQEKIRDEYPIFEMVDSVDYKTIIDQKEKTQKNESFEYKRFDFSSSDKKIKVSVAYNVLTIEVFEYKSFRPFCERVEKLNSAFSEVYSPISITRMGLRYINEFKFPEGTPFSNEKYINPSLTRKEKEFLKADRALVRSMSQAILNRDDHMIVFINGYYNGEYPNSITRNEYIIDIDSSTKEIAIENVCSRMKVFNEEMVELFEKSITEEVRKLMGVVND